MGEPRLKDPDLSPFRGTGKLTWGQRKQLIEEHFPSVTSEFNWKKAFDRDIELMGHILRDVLKAEQAVPGRPGPRPGVDASQAQPVVDQWMGQDHRNRPYTTLPFAQAFSLLANGDSRTILGRKLGMSRVMVHRLLVGTMEPNPQVMRQIAEHYGKSPAFFLEYRTAFVASMIHDSMFRKPERSIQLFEKVQQFLVPQGHYESTE